MPQITRMTLQIAPNNPSHQPASHSNTHIRFCRKRKYFEWCLGVWFFVVVVGCYPRQNPSPTIAISISHSTCLQLVLDQCVYLSVLGIHKNAAKKKICHQRGNGIKYGLTKDIWNDFYLWANGTRHQCSLKLQVSVKYTIPNQIAEQQQQMLEIVLMEMRLHRNVLFCSFR